MILIDYSILDDMLEQFEQAIFVPAFDTDASDREQYLADITARYPEPEYCVAIDDIGDIYIYIWKE